MIRIEDRIAIQDHASRYAHYIDTFQVENALAMFADDALFDESRLGLGSYKGKDEIRQFFEAIKAGMKSMSHNNTNFVVESLADSNAKVIMYSMFKGITVDGKRMSALFYYVDEYVKQGGQWLFSSRVTYPLHPFDLSAFGSA